MNAAKVALSATLLMLTACETCREHPVACTAVAAVAVGVAAAAAEHRIDRRPYIKDWNPSATAWGPQY